MIKTVLIGLLIIYMVLLIILATIQAFILLKKKVCSWLDRRLDELRTYHERKGDKYSKKSFKDIHLQMQKDYLTINVNKNIGKGDIALLAILGLVLWIIAVLFVYHHKYLEFSLWFSCFYAFLLFAVGLLSFSMCFLVKNVINKYKDARPQDSIIGKDMRFEGDRLSLLFSLLPVWIYSIACFTFAISHMDLILPVILYFFLTAFVASPLAVCFLEKIWGWAADRLIILSQFKMQYDVKVFFAFLLVFVFMELGNRLILDRHFERTEKGLSDIEKQKMYIRYEAQYSVFRVWMIMIDSVLIVMLFSQWSRIYSGAAAAISLLALKETLVDRNKEEERAGLERNDRDARRRRRKKDAE